MFCFQCEQTANCKGCKGSSGVCGKSALTSDAQDKLTGALIYSAMSGSNDYDLFIDGLFTTVTNVNFSAEKVNSIAKRAGSSSYDMSKNGMNELLPLVMETGRVNLKCMALLDRANTETYGVPSPVKVSRRVEKGPFIVITGHDLKDLEELLRQTQGKGINVYTHGEMLPAHSYPELRKYSHLKGNFGTAWQNQQKEFDDIPGGTLMTGFGHGAVQ